VCALRARLVLSTRRTAGHGAAGDTGIAEQRPLELALSQPESASHQAQEITLAQLPGSSIELGASRRDQRRRSSALSAASSIARHYQPLDDDMEVSQDRL
jgi:hypothetical protein